MLHMVAIDNIAASLMTYVDDDYSFILKLRWNYSVQIHGTLAAILGHKRHNSPPGYIYEQEDCNVRFEVFTAVTMRNVVF
jgi:hypothetical protein